METCTLTTEALSFLLGEFADGIDVHGGDPSRGLVRRAVRGRGTLRKTGGRSKTGPVSDGVNSLGDGFCCGNVSWLLDCDEGADVFLEALDVEVQARGCIHVGEVKHDGSEFVAILVDRHALIEVTEVVIGVGQDIDGDELLPK